MATDAANWFHWVAMTAAQTAPLFRILQTLRRQLAIRRARHSQGRRWRRPLSVLISDYAPAALVTATGGASFRAMRRRT